MPHVVAIGREEEVRGLALVGVHVVPAASAAEARAAWRSLGADVGVAVLGPNAARAIGPDRWETGAPMALVIPESSGAAP